MIGFEWQRFDLHIDVYTVWICMVEMIGLAVEDCDMWIITCQTLGLHKEVPGLSNAEVEQGDAYPTICFVTWYVWAWKDRLQIPSWTWKADEAAYECKQCWDILSFNRSIIWAKKPRWLTGFLLPLQYKPIVDSCSCPLLHFCPPKKRW